MIERLRRRWLSWRASRLFGQKVAVFGDFTVVRPENVRFGKGCAINHDVFILGQCGIDIGDYVVLSARVMLVDTGLDPDTFVDPWQRKYVEGRIRIGDASWIGAGAIILAGVTIGERSVVGAGSVVTKDVPPLSVVAGSPAKVIRKIGE